MSTTSMHLDAAETVFFERQLEVTKAKTYDVKYPQFRARELIPVDNTEDPGAETVRYEQYDQVGMAKIIASYAADLPRAEVKGKEFRQAIKSLGVSYGYTLQEIRNARLAGKPLEQRKANAAMKANELAVDNIAFGGDSEHGLQGINTLANAQQYVIPNGASASALWSSKTPLEILADLNGITNAQVANTNGLELPDSVVLPIEQYGLIATTPLQAASAVTILQHFLANNPWVKSVSSWYKLKGAGAGGKDRMLCYRKDPDALQLVIPVEFEQLPVQVTGFRFEIPCHSRIGGVLAYYPMSVSYGDGI